jgi:O-antigen/teichoic acid export membrane protein
MVVGMASAAALAAAAVALPSSWGGRELQVALAAAAAAVFFMQAQEFFRRVLLTRARPRAAFVNDAIVTALAVGGLAALHLQDGTGGASGRWLTAGSALVVLAAASAVGVVLGAGQARTLLGRPLPDIRTYLAQNWAFGRWILGSRLGETLINQANNFIIVALSGTAAAAALDAPRLLVAPLQVVSFGLFNLLVPGETQVFEREGAPGLRRYLRRHGATFVLLFGLYAGVVAAYPRGWLRLAYGGRYDDPLILLLWTGAHLLLAVRVILSTVLYVTRRSDLVMHAMLGTGVVTVALTAVLAGSMAERGAAVARLCGEALLLAWIAVLVPRATSAKMGSAT